MKRRILSIITALVLCLGLLPGTALAVDTNPVLDISNGSIWIADGRYVQAKTVTRPSAWTDYTGEITITGTSASWYSVDVTSGTHTIRLKDAAIKPQANQDDMRDGTPALSISQSTVNLILEGTSTLKGSCSYTQESLGKECVNLSASNLSITGGGTLNIQGGDSLRQAEASFPIGGNGFYLLKSTLRVSDGAVLNVTGGNMSLGNNWWGVGIYASNSSIELSGGTLFSKGVEGFDLRSSRLSQSGGTLSVEGVRGITSVENQEFQAEISSGSANIHSYIYSALRRGSLTVSGGEVTLRTDSSLGAVDPTASVTVSPASGYAGILKNGDGPDSAARTPIPEEKTLSSISGKYANITFSNEKHSLTVQGGGTGASGTGSYLPGQTVDIRAGTMEGKDFKWWEKVSGDGVFANAEAADTTFTMGWEDAEIRPVFVTGKVVGDFVVSTEDESGYTYENGVLTISRSGTYAISMREPGTATGNRIRLNGGNPTVILDGVQINSGESAITLDPSSTTNATLMLSGVNKLSATGLNAGIAVWTSNPTYYSVSLTITSLAGDGSSEGRLETTGCSGIGAYGSQDSGAITINGGTIIATGNRNGSYGGYGIGSKGSNPVTINGGDVTATGEQGFSNNLILNNNPSIQVNGDFKNGVSGGESPVRVYYDSQGGSTVKSVAVIPQDGKVLTSEALQLSAQVEGGGNADKTVAWSVTGALSEGTSIDENGLLTVAAGEKAAALTVTALNSYSGLSDSATVTVTKKLLLPAPTGLQLSLPDKASRNSLDAAASWDAVDEAASYLVQLYKNGTAEGGEISVTGTSHHFSIRSQGKYTFKVRAVRSDGAEGQEAESEAKQIYLVSFTPDNKLDPSLSQLSAAGGKLERPEDPVKAGYTFGGWKNGPFSSNLWDFQNDTVKNSATLFALWKKNYTVTVQTDGNGSASASPNSAAEGTAITLTAAANSGYHFKEWEVVSGGVSISNDSFTMPERDVTVKAVFEQDAPETYTVTVQTEGSGRASASPASATAGTTISLTATADSGYHFKEWQVVSGGVTISNDSFTMPEGNVTIKAVFEQDAPPEHVHKWDSAWNRDGNHHWHECLADGCDIASNSGKDGYGAHIYDDEQDTDCNVCGHIRTVTPPGPEHVHKWAAVWSGDGNHHWHECFADGCDITSDSGKDGYAAHVYDNEQDTDCNVCGHVREVTPPEQPDDETTKIEIAEGIVEVPPALAELKHLNTPEKIAQAMRAAITQTGVPARNTAVYDVTLMISTDGGATWTTATAADFPANGLTVTLPYPAGTNSSYTFTVVHMFTTSDFNKTPGDTETPRVTNTASGLQFTVTGLSPISVGWVQPSTPTTPTGPTGGGGGGGGGSSSAYAVTVERAEHGKVTSNRTNASSGSTVTLTVMPDTGYVLDTLTVTDSRGSEIKLTAQGGGKYTFTMPGRAVTVKAAFAPLPDDTEKPCDGGVDCPSHGFTDLGTVGTWYHEAVDYVLRNNLMGGYGNGLFGPNDTLTRAQFAQILYNKEGRPAVTGGGIFTDVAPSAWCAPAITWAAERGIVGGYGNGMFGPNDNITREQLAVMLWRYAGSPAATDKELHFNDAGKASGYALDALRWAVENGVMSGKGGGILDPKGLATRAQTAQMLKNFLGK